MPTGAAHDSPAGRSGRLLVIKSGAGLADPERCMQAFTVAATALAAGAEVSMWLMGDAVEVAVPGRAQTLVLSDAPALSGLVATVIDGGRLTVCTQCAARRGLTVDDLVPGARVAGSASYVEEVLAPDAQALIY